MKKIIALLGIITLFCACGQGNKNQTTKNTDTTTDIVPMSQIVFGGNRYVVEADFGLEKTVPMMVHGNASFYMMITHDIAEQLNNGQPIKKIDDYGYSDRGRGRITVGNLSVGNHTFSNIENVPVFDWPAEEGKAAQGMLGVEFLKNENVKIDFVNEQLEIGVAKSDEPDKKLMEQGYAFTKFFIEKSEVFMNVYFEALQKEIPITIGTVASDYSFDVETFKNAIKTDATHTKDHSPDNTTPDVFINTEPIRYRIGEQNFEIPAKGSELSGFAEYGNTTQEELPSFGIFGRDWMVRNKAVIDYANRILYFKPAGR